jgi:hypothetical protein
MQKPSSTLPLLLSSIAAFLLIGCAGPISKPSQLMQKTSALSGPAPAEKSLVIIHRPRAAQGYALYTGVWDSTNFIADLGNGHSVDYVCEPGPHYFINRSVERIGVVQAQLLPAQTYDLRVETAGAFIASFQLEPVKSHDKLSKEIPKWTKEHLWVTRGPTAADHELAKQKEIELIMKDFVSGPKKDRIRKLDAEDHR